MRRNNDDCLLGAVSDLDELGDWMVVHYGPRCYLDDVKTGWDVPLDTESAHTHSRADLALVGLPADRPVVCILPELAENRQCGCGWSILMWHEVAHALDDYVGGHEHGEEWARIRMLLDHGAEVDVVRHADMRVDLDTIADLAGDPTYPLLMDRYRSDPMYQRILNAVRAAEAAELRGEGGAA